MSFIYLFKCCLLYTIHTEHSTQFIQSKSVFISSRYMTQLLMKALKSGTAHRLSVRVQVTRILSQGHAPRDISGGLAHIGPVGSFGWREDQDGLQKSPEMLEWTNWCDPTTIHPKRQVKDNWVQKSVNQERFWYLQGGTNSSGTPRSRICAKCVLRLLAETACHSDLWA